jgi:hypothetical protein
MADLTQESAEAIVASYRALETGALADRPGMTPAEQFSFRAVELGLEEPGFDWMNWEPVTSGAFESADVAAGADAEELKRLMTAHVRVNRFSGGHLDRMQEEGVLARIVERLDSLAEAGEI